MTRCAFFGSALAAFDERKFFLCESETRRTNFSTIRGSRGAIVSGVFLFRLYSAPRKERERVLTLSEPRMRGGVATLLNSATITGFIGDK